MPIELDCDYCGARLRVADQHAGKLARCPKCERLNRAPDEFSPERQNQPVPQADERASGEPQFFPPSPKPEAAPDNPYAPGAGTIVAPPVGLKPHRGTTILVMGILAIFCNVFLVPGLYAWLAGRNDLQQMKAGHMDRQGEDLTRVGMIIGIVMTCIAGIGMIIQFLMLVLMAAGGALL